MPNDVPSVISIPICFVSWSVPQEKRPDDQRSLDVVALLQEDNPEP